MKKERHIILAIHVTNRVKSVKTLQDVFTEYGCFIKTRIGLHEASEDFCSTNGLIILELLGNLDKADEFEAKLKAVGGIEVQKVVFEHDADNMLAK